MTTVKTNKLGRLMTLKGRGWAILGSELHSTETTTPPTRHARSSRLVEGDHSGSENVLWRAQEVRRGRRFVPTPSSCISGSSEMVLGCGVDCQTAKARSDS